MDIEIKLVEDLEDQLEQIKKRMKNFNNLWTLYSFVDKLLIIIQFATLLYSILLISLASENMIGIILSLYTLSVSTVVDKLKPYLVILENLVSVYEDFIIPDIDNYKRGISANLCYNTDSVIKLEAAAAECYNIEQRHIKIQMGEKFVLPTTLKSMNCRKIIGCGVSYLVCFILIPVVYFYGFKT